MRTKEIEVILKGLNNRDRKEIEFDLDPAAKNTYRF